MLYIAMEDYRIDMILPDGGSVTLPLRPFTLIGATTKPEALSIPLKNRFVYSFHLEPYSEQEKKQLLLRYITKNNISISKQVLEEIAQYATHTPREITTMSIQIRDYLSVHTTRSKE
jgi:Holliday junction DNA helicase RuvB